ncbi:hypothetical protein MSAN_01182600 [Mycena sanguinolenta]|uniref:F-box domain-containing protein n=1 Tax=Mycena sanguinolenta TaxID=230812 RepID=A0A8H6YMQ9_9AGAR|nr:hypothetical protein MSAN_01182600 [Mycena sanguinolenta]
MKQHLPVLPADIWECVASFLSLRELLPLISVNRALYNIVLDTKYREILWDKLDVHMSKTLVRLRTPSIAMRVRRLHIRAWFIEYLIRKAFTPHSYVVNSKRWISQYLRLPPRITPSTGGKSSSAGDILESMTQAVRLMTHVTEYSFEWRDLSPTPETLRFLSAGRAAFGVSLRKLVLHAQLSNFAALLTTVDFENLEELELFLDHDHSVGAHSADLLRGCIAPFVNHFRRTLASLLISSASKADVAPLLEALQGVPHLRTLVGRFAFDTVHLSDPGGLVKILRTHADTLLNVELGWSFAASLESDSDADQPSVPALSTWGAFSAAVFADPAVFVNLTSFKLPCLSTFDSTLQCLRRSADTLTSLHLVDHFLRDQELTDLVGVFAHRPFDAGLQSLHLGLMHFGVETLDLLAGRVPGLRSLGLVLTPTTVAEISHREYSPTSLFCESLAKRSYPDWALSNLGIWEKRFIDTTYTIPDELMIMQHIARCIPKVQTFKGQSKVEGRCRAWLPGVDDA